MLFVHSSDELYGADRMLLAQVDAVPAGVDVEVWLPNDVAHPERPLCPELTKRGVTVRHVPVPILRRQYETPRGLLALARRLAWLLGALLRNRRDIVYCTTSACLLAAPVARLFRTKLVVGHVHEVWTSHERRLLAAPAAFCHRVIAISRPVADALPERLQERTQTVLNGIAAGVADRPGEARSGPMTYLVASRWNAWKGHATLLAAWDELDDGRLLVLGGPPPAGAATDVPGLVRALRRPESVVLIGEVDDVAGYLQQADVVLVPSDQPEPFGLVAIEAFAQRRPVVASRAGGLIDIVTDGVDGWLFEPRDPADLARVLRSLTREQASAAGQRARSSYERRFTAQRYAQQWRAALAPHLGE